jgi:hypothetical protein
MSYVVKINSDTENYTETYDELIDAANAFSIECGGEEITSTPIEFHNVGGGQEVAEDVEQFGGLIVRIPECNYKASIIAHELRDQDRL